jgi:hypothetical protein
MPSDFVIDGPSPASLILDLHLFLQLVSRERIARIARRQRWNARVKDTVFREWYNRIQK